MTYDIKELNQAIMKDYIDFFDNHAVSDCNPNGPCYCMSPNIYMATERKMVSEFGNDIKGSIRRYAVEMLNEDRIQRYLAFDGDISIGW